MNQVEVSLLTPSGRVRVEFANGELVNLEHHEAMRLFERLAQVLYLRDGSWPLLPAPKLAKRRGR